MRTDAGLISMIGSKLVTPLVPVYLEYNKEIWISSKKSKCNEFAFFECLMYSFGFMIMLSSI